MSVGTGAFSSVEAERDVAVNVVDDDEAYLGLDVEHEVATVGRSVEVAEITNSFADELSLDVTVEDANEVVDDVAVDEDDPGDEFSLELGPGESAPIAVTCGRIGTASFTLRFTGGTGGASVEKERTFDEVECQVNDVMFRGRSGDVAIEGDFTDLEVTVVFESGTAVARTVSSGPNEEASLHPREGGDGGDDAIERVEIGSVAYERPDTQSGSGESGSSQS